MKVTKEIEFCCAHRLPNYDGPCKNIHGHNYKVQVTFEGEIIEIGGREGMVMDFKVLKGFMKERIYNPFDHALVLEKADENYILFFSGEKQKLVVMEDPPTAENMAKFFHDEMQPEMDAYDIKVTNVRVYETPTSWADSSE